MKTHESSDCSRFAVTGLYLRTALIAGLLLFNLAGRALAQDDLFKYVETKRAELADREEAVKKEEQRLNVLRKDVDDRIDKYTALLTKIEAAVGKVEQARQERVDSVVKAYEAMAAEDAAARLAVLDDDTALLILKRMKSKKTGAIMAFMKPQKAAQLTRQLTALQ